MTKPEDVPSQAQSRRGLGWVFTGLLLAIFLASLDQTIVATALPTVAGELHGLEISDVFLVAAGVASAGFLVVLLLPERPLRKAGAAAGGPPPGQRPVGAGAGSDTETRPGGSRT